MSITLISRTLITAVLVTASAGSAATVHANVVYYVNEAVDTILASNASQSNSVSASASYTAPSGTTMSGVAGFDSGRFYGLSTISREAPLAFTETLTSASSFRDVLTIDTGGACPIGGPACQLSFSYTATGTYSATGDVQFGEAQLDFAVLNPTTPGDRSTWLVDHPVFLQPGAVSITDDASVPFFDQQAFVFWPVFGVVARQVANSAGSSTLDFSHSLVFNNFAVLNSSGNSIAFDIDAESGLVYSGSGIAAVPEPSTSALMVGGAFVLWMTRRHRRRSSSRC
jgi:hypothetical protein